MVMWLKYKTNKRSNYYQSQDGNSSIRQGQHLTEKGQKEGGWDSIYRVVMFYFLLFMHTYAYNIIYIYALSIYIFHTKV